MYVLFVSLENALLDVKFYCQPLIFIQQYPCAAFYIVNMGTVSN